MRALAQEIAQLDRATAYALLAVGASLVSATCTVLIIALRRSVRGTRTRSVAWRIKVEGDEAAKAALEKVARQGRAAIKDQA